MDETKNNDTIIITSSNKIVNNEELTEIINNTHYNTNEDARNLESIINSSLLLEKKIKQQSAIKKR